MNAIDLRACLIIAAAIATLGGAAGPASAVTLPPGYGYFASQSVAASVDGIGVASQSSNAIGSISASNASPGGTIGPGTASVSGGIVITPSPKISASATTTFATPPSGYNTRDAGYGANSSYSGRLFYYFEIAGPTTSVAVNAKAVASYSTSALPSGGNGSGLINFNVTQLDNLGDPVSPLVLADSTSIFFGSFKTPTAATSGGFTENGTNNLLTNTIYRVAMQVVFNVAVDNAGVSDPSSPGGTGTFLASLDPTFKIGAGVADPGQYSFVFSDGIGNSVAAAPLPATLPLLGTGIGALSLIGARRKRKSAAA